RRWPRLPHRRRGRRAAAPGRLRHRRRPPPRAAHRAPPLASHRPPSAPWTNNSPPLPDRPPGSPPVPIRAVWFDVGEVLINESREYHTWADWLGIPRHTFSAMFGAVIARGEDYRDVFGYFRPGFDLEAERQARLDAGLGEYLNAADLYPDVRPCLAALQ